MSASAVLALGSNLGESRTILEQAVERLDGHERITVTGVSPLVSTAPVGGPEGQPDFWNQVVSVETTLRPFALLKTLQGLEDEFHRVREVRWGPRTLDLDIITYAQLVMDEPELTLPHPRAAERAFVLVPWSQMDAQASLQGVPVAELAQQAPDRNGIRECVEVPR